MVPARYALSLRFLGKSLSSSLTWMRGRFNYNITRVREARRAVRENHPKNLPRSSSKVFWSVAGLKTQ